MGCTASKQKSEEARASSQRSSCTYPLTQPRPAGHPLRIYRCGKHFAIIKSDGLMRRSTFSDSKLKQEASAAKKELKLLLLGAGESGKTTIRNQMRYIDGIPLTAEEREQFTDVCRSNMISSMQIVLDNMLLLGIELADPSLRDSANLIVELENQSGSVGMTADGELLPGVLEAIVLLWADANVQHTAKERSNEYQLNDSAEYFLDEATRIGTNGWKPTDMDVLKARVKTMGISGECAHAFVRNQASYRTRP